MEPSDEVEVLIMCPMTQSFSGDLILLEKMMPASSESTAQAAARATGRVGAPLSTRQTVFNSLGV